MKKYNIAIIGGGPAGYTAALYSARAGLSVVLFEELAPGGQMATTSAIENYPGFDETVDGFELGQKMKNGAEKAGAESIFEEVTKLDLSALPKTIKTTEGEYSADAVIIAAGANPRELGIEHEKELRGRGVSYCATCDGMMYRNKAVAVIGGGNTAAEDALYLSKLCKKVYLIHRRSSLRASVSYQKQLEMAENVEILWNSVPSEFIFDNIIKGIKLKDTVSKNEYPIDCDGIFIAIGRTPNTALVKGQLELDESGYIISDETTKTNIPGVFAAGDIRTKPLRQIVTAASDGAVASKFAEEYIAELN